MGVMSLHMHKAIWLKTAELASKKKNLVSMAFEGQHLHIYFWFHYQGCLLVARAANFFSRRSLRNRLQSLQNVPFISPPLHLTHQDPPSLASSLLTSSWAQILINSQTSLPWKTVMGPQWGGSSKGLNFCRILLHPPHCLQQHSSQGICVFFSCWSGRKNIPK